MACSIRGASGLARFVSYLHVTIPAYPERSAAASGHGRAFCEQEATTVEASRAADRLCKNVVNCVLTAVCWLRLDEAWTGAAIIRACWTYFVI